MGINQPPPPTTPYPYLKILILCLHKYHCLESHYHNGQCSVPCITFQSCSFALNKNSSVLSTLSNISILFPNSISQNHYISVISALYNISICPPIPLPVITIVQCSAPSITVQLIILGQSQIQIKNTNYPGHPTYYRYDKNPVSEPLYRI